MTDKTQPIMRFNVYGGLMNPEARGLYVRYEDHIAALQASPPAPAAVAVPDESRLRKAVQAWIDLKDEIRSSKRPPHVDFWHQSISESEDELRAALAAATAAAPVVLPEHWGVCVGGRIWIGKTPEHVLKLEEQEGMEPTLLFTEQQVRALLATGGQAQAAGRDLQAVVTAAAEKLDAAKRCHPNAVDHLIDEALEILDGDREPQAQADARDALPEIKDMLNSPQHLNLNDRAFWVLGWNECRDSVRDSQRAAQAAQGE